MRAEQPPSLSRVLRSRKQKTKNSVINEMSVLAVYGLRFGNIVVGWQKTARIGLIIRSIRYSVLECMTQLHGPDNWLFWGAAEPIKFTPPNDLLSQSALSNKNGVRNPAPVLVRTTQSISPTNFVYHFFFSFPIRCERKKRASITLSSPVRSPIYHFINSNQFLAVFIYHRSASQPAPNTEQNHIKQTEKRAIYETINARWQSINKIDLFSPVNIHLKRH